MFFTAVASPNSSALESLHPAAWSAPVSLLTGAELTARAYLGSEVAHNRRTARFARANRSSTASSRTHRFMSFSFGATR